jgi:DNA-binding MarR family transcriptional regulator
MTSDSAQPDVPARLALVTGRLNRRLRTAGGGLSHGLLSALYTVSKQGPLRLAELAQLELVSAPSTTRLVTELESKGYVSRAADPEDGRAVLISVTAAGVETVNVARSARAEMIAEMLDQLAPEEFAAIVAAVPALEKAIELG